jgi:hypothetical protein
VFIGKVRTIEAERREHEQTYTPLPEDAEVTFEYRGTDKKVILKPGDDAWAQAQAAQKAHGHMLLFSPIDIY